MRHERRPFVVAGALRGERVGQQERHDLGHPDGALLGVAEAGHPLPGDQRPAVDLGAEQSGRAVADRGHHTSGAVDVLHQPDQGRIAAAGRTPPRARRSDRPAGADPRSRPYAALAPTPVSPAGRAGSSRGPDCRGPRLPTAGGPPLEKRCRAGSRVRVSTVHASSTSGRYAPVGRPVAPSSDVLVRTSRASGRVMTTGPTGTPRPAPHRSWAGPRRWPARSSVRSSQRPGRPGRRAARPDTPRRPAAR